MKTLSLCSFISYFFSSKFTELKIKYSRSLLYFLSSLLKLFKFPFLYNTFNSSIGVIVYVLFVFFLILFTNFYDNILLLCVRFLYISFSFDKLSTFWFLLFYVFLYSSFVFNLFISSALYYIDIYFVFLLYKWFSTSISNSCIMFFTSLIYCE